jgi:hypothetical protein
LNGDGTGTATAVYTDVSGSVLNGSTAIAELPDGTVLVANSGTGQIDRFTVNGVAAAARSGTGPLIKDAFTANITEILIVEGH